MSEGRGEGAAFYAFLSCKIETEIETRQKQTPTLN